MGIDIFCNFGLINVLNMMIFFDFGKLIKIMICVLIFVIDLLNIEVVLIIKNGNV